MYRIAIAAHPARSVQAHALFEQVGAAMLAMDNGSYGCGPNHHRCWSYLAKHNPAEYGVVLEDDCEPVDGFNDQLEQVLAASPSPVVGLYLGNPEHWSTYPQRKQRILQAGRAADEQDACFITTTDLLHGVGIAIKTELIQSMLDYTTTCDRPYDYAIRNWARDKRHSIAFTWPSIVNHLDLPTLIKHPDGLERGQRKAWKTGTRDTWTNKTVTM
jgi:GR25 family glycosyltransferase involved in LPS biosynthesis